MKSFNEETFMFDKAKELLKSNISEQTRIGTKIIIYLFIEKYAPVIELFNFICDERDSPKLHKNIDTLERILIEHFFNNRLRLGVWENEDE